MKCVVMFLGMMLVSSVAMAQNATPSKRLGWDQQAASAAEAESFTYKHYLDGNLSGVVLSPVTCVVGPVAGTFTCSTPFPAVTPGSHTSQVSAANEAGESLKSNVFAYTFVVIPQTPENLRMVS